MTPMNADVLLLPVPVYPCVTAKSAVFPFYFFQVGNSRGTKRNLRSADVADQLAKRLDMPRDCDVGVLFRFIFEHNVTTVAGVCQNLHDPGQIGLFLLADGRKFGLE